MNRVRTTLLSIRLDSCFGLVGPHQQPAIDSNVDPARNHLYQASAPAAGIQDSNVVTPPAAHSCAKRRSIEALCRQHGLGRERRSKKRGAIYRQTVRGLPGIVGIEYELHYSQYGWTAVSVWLDLISNRQLTVMWIQLETTYTQRVHPQQEYKIRMW